MDTCIYTTLHHFHVKIVKLLVCTKLACCTKIVYTKLSFSLLSQCGINWIYYLYSQYKQNILLRHSMLLIYK